MRAWERERVLEEMTSRIKSHPESFHHCVHTPATATHLATCIQIQMRPFLTSSHSWHGCHSVPWQSGEKVRRSIIPLLTGRVRRPWPPRLNFKWITGGGGLYVKRETVRHMTGNYFPWCHSVNGSLPSPLLLRAAPPARLTFDRHFFRVQAERRWQFVAAAGQKLNTGGRHSCECEEAEGGGKDVDERRRDRVGGIFFFFFF